VRIERFTELEELIMAGYGDMRARDIPPDWRTRRPYPISTPVEKAVETEEQALARQLWERDTAKRSERARAWQAKARTIRAQKRLFKQAAMRARNLQAQQSQRRNEYVRETGKVEVRGES
jgi:hypothetical protein